MTAIAEHIFVLTHHLREKYQTLSDDVMVIGNGFAPEFIEHPEPPRSPPTYISLPNKRIGFIGRLRNWLDFDLINDLVESFPSFSFIFLGPIDENVSVKMRELSRFPNVFLLGPVSRRCAYWHMRQLDICLLPYLNTRFTRGVKPIKMIEALACGVPVATTLSADIAEFGDCVRHFGNSVEFGAAVKHLGDNDKMALACRSVAARYSWDAIAARVAARLTAQS
jgi:glycosyltransferase involved in cell wall biosynthesis